MAAIDLGQLGQWLADVADATMGRPLSARCSDCRHRLAFRLTLVQLVKDPPIRCPCGSVTHLSKLDRSK